MYNWVAEYRNDIGYMINLIIEYIENVLKTLLLSLLHIFKKFLHLHRTHIPCISLCNLLFSNWLFIY